MSIPHKAVELLHEGWREHSRTGFHVTFLVGPEESDFFRSLKAGQRLSAVLVCLNDDDQPAPVPGPAEKAKEDAKRLKTALADAGVLPQEGLRITPAGSATVLDGGEPKPEHVANKFPTGLCGLAVRWCADEHFQNWMQSAYPAGWDTYAAAGNAEEVAKQVICGLCDIGSRKELDTVDKARRMFEERIRGPYAAWRLEDGVDGEDPF